MVYHGKPSLACSLCRIRKIKCDQIRPACSQCLRVKAECHGYRNPSDLIFRNQRPGLEYKLYAAGPSEQQLKKTRTNDLVAWSHINNPVFAIPTPQNELAPSIFFKFFEVNDPATGYALTSCLPERLSRNDDDPLTAAIMSVGFTLLSRLTNSSDALRIARLQYGKAIRLTFHMLQNYAARETCWVIRVILILAISELFTSDSPSDIAWSTHLEGATTLFKTRGVDISNCILGMKGLKLFFQLRSQLLTSCLQRQAPVPEIISQLSNTVKCHMVHDELLATELADITVRLANFRAAMANAGSFHSDYTLATLQQLESDLRQWVSSLPPSWGYKTHRVLARNEFYTTSCHIYPGFSVAASWNQYRITRCLVNDLILAHLDFCTNLDLDYFGQDERFHLAKDIIKTMCDGICDSVPYFTGQTGKNDSHKPGVGALEIMWALAIVAGTYSLTDGQKQWAVAQLEKVGNDMGILQALKLASLAKPMIRVNGMAHRS